MIKACTGIFMFGQHPGLQKGKHGYFSFRREMMDVSSAWKMRFRKEYWGKDVKMALSRTFFRSPNFKQVMIFVSPILKPCIPTQRLECCT